MRPLPLLSFSVFEAGVAPFTTPLSSFRRLAVGVEVDAWGCATVLSSTGMGYGE